jgi:hypothetical protein
MVDKSQSTIAILFRPNFTLRFSARAFWRSHEKTAPSEPSGGHAAADADANQKFLL